MTSRNQSGLIGVVVAGILLWMFFFHIVGLFLLAIAAIIGFPVGILVHWMRKRKNQ
jgi:hypothetical protein